MTTATTATTATAPTGTEIPIPVTLGSPALAGDPLSHYSWLREEAPVHDGRMPAVTDRPVWLVSRYADCRALLTDARFRRAPHGEAGVAGDLPEHLRLVTSDSLVYRDDPDHLRLRRLVATPFTPRAVARLGERVRAVAHARLDALDASAPVDLRDDYALPIPGTVVAEMLGVEESERDRFLTTVRAAFGGVAGGTDRASWDRSVRAAVELVGDLVERRRSAPGDDVLSGLIRAEEHGERLSERELVAMVFTLLAAGYETTFGLVTNAVAALLDHPDVLARLRERPDDDVLWRGAVEELVRWTGTVAGTELLTAVTDVRWHGRRIPEGATLVPLLAAANRDPRAFPNPDRLDVERSGNPHLGFGHGTHTCLGAHLARLETRVALQVLLERCPRLRLAVPREELTLEPVPLLTRWSRLPVHLA